MNFLAWIAGIAVFCGCGTYLMVHDHELIGFMLLVVAACLDIEDKRK